MKKESKTIKILSYIIAILFVASVVVSLIFNQKPASETIEKQAAETVKTSNIVSASTSPSSPKSVSQYAPVDVDMTLKQISEHVWFVQGKAGMATDNAGFISNAGVIITEEGVIIFDALGTPSLANKLIKKIRQITDKPIIKVFVSHYHADHIYGLQVFKEQGAEIIAPAGVYEYLDSETAANRLEERQLTLDPWVNDKTYLVTPDQVIDKTTRFNIGNINFTVNMMGSAHSEGDMTLYVENDRVLFTGDLIFEGRVPFIGSDNTKHWLESLKNIENQKLHALVPGHGGLAKDPTQAIKLTRTYLAFLRNKMGTAVEAMTDFDEAYKAIDWSDYENLPAFEAANRKNAFQVYLSMENESL